MSKSSQKLDIKQSIEKQKLENKQKLESAFKINVNDGNLYLKQDSQTVSGQRSAFVVEESNSSDEQSPNIKLSKLQDSSPKKRYAKDPEIEKQSDDEVKTLPQLVKLDLNLDTLKTFLEDIQEAINDHATTIKNMQQDLKRKAYEKTLGQYFMRISEGLHKECGEKPHSIRIDDSSALAETYQTEDSILFKRASDKIVDKFEIIGLNIINLSKHKTEVLERLDRIEKFLPKCFTLDQFRDESNILETRINKYMKDQLGMYQTNLNGYKTELQESLTFFEKKVNDNQADTLWRIKDCEDLLKSRVSDKFVNDAIKALDDKLQKQISFGDEKQVDRLEKAFKELGQRVIQTNNLLNEKFEDCKKMLSQYDGKLLNVATMDKLMGVQAGYKDMKYNFEREFETLTEHVRDTKDKIGELTKRFSNLEQVQNTQMADFGYPIMTHTPSHHGQTQPNSNNAIQSHPTGNSPQWGQQQPSKPQQPHLQPTIQDFSKSKTTAAMNKSPTPKSGPPQHQDTLKDAVQINFMNNTQQSNNLNASPPPHYTSPLGRKRGSNAAAISVEVERKLMHIDEQVQFFQSQIDYMKTVLDEKVHRDDIKKMTSDKVSKDELMQLLPSEDLIMEKIKFMMQQEVEHMQKQLVEQAKSLDQRLVRFRSELDVHSLFKIVEKKANEDQVRNDFSNHEFKIGTLDRNLIRMASDFETFQTAINKLHFAIVELQDANKDVLLGKKAINCLSCGKGGEPQQTVKGTDGKLYKGELGNIKLAQDDIGLYDNANPLMPNSYMPTNLGINNDLSLEQRKMTASHSFYDQLNPQAVYENQNLPSVHKKINSYGSFKYRSAGTTYSNAANATVQHTHNVSLHQSKKKLPFGFQVQQEKKELFKIRGKSSYGQRPTSHGVYDRPDSASNADRKGLNMTFD